MFNESKIKKAELFQLLLLNSIYSQSASKHIIFQGGTALRWVYGGMRFSEDLNFVTTLSATEIEKLVESMFKNMNHFCTAQFGLGSIEQKRKKRRAEAFQVLFIYRPEKKRERIAVKVEFERLQDGCLPEYAHVVLRDLPSVTSMIASGALMMPYSSSVILAETGEEILSDKIRAIYERKYIKGRDIYDIWWLSEQRKINVDWPAVHKKLSMYSYQFKPAREADFFQNKENQQETINALQTDLNRFIPENIYSVYQATQFVHFIKAVNLVTSKLLQQGMKMYFESLRNKS